MRPVSALLGLLGFAVGASVPAAALAAEPVAPQAPALSAAAAPVAAPALIPAPALAPAAAASAAAKDPAPARLSAKGRFLYANDDDWDWASPKGKLTTNLSVNGEMDWSALDWIEEGLPEIRGLVLGTLPLEALRPADDLDEARGRRGKKAYATEPPAAGTLAKRLGAGDAAAPNVVLLVRGSAGDPPPDFSAEDLEALHDLVARGGRLIVLDEWGCYRPVLDRFLSGRPPRRKPPDPGPSENLRSRVAALVPQLGDEQWGVRENATHGLLSLGPRVLPLIRRAESPDPEVRMRLEAIAGELAAAAAAEAAAAAAERRPLSDAAVERALPAARKSGATAELRRIVRNQGQEPGRALLLEVALAAQGAAPAAGASTLKASKE